MSQTASVRGVVLEYLLFWPLIGIMAGFPERKEHRGIVRLALSVIWLGLGWVSIGLIVGTWGLMNLLILVGVTALWFVGDIVAICWTIGKAD